MKVLCLHGLRHNAKLLERSMKSLKGFNFKYIDSPLEFEPGLFKWWSATRDNALAIDHYDTVYDSLNFVKQEWEKEDYKGILGFSQGSVLLQIFCYLVQSGQIKTRDPEFAIFCNTSEISDKNLHTLYKTKLKYKSIFVYGETDPFISPESVKKVAKLLSENPQYLAHDGGHYVGLKGESLRKMVEEK